MTAEHPEGWLLESDCDDIDPYHPVENLKL